MKIYLETLGCDKNLVDAEKMLAGFIKEGHELSLLPEEADLLVVNTCCFIGDAKEESIQAILKLAEEKERDPKKKILVTGCLAERYRDEVLTELPEVDAVFGLSSEEQLRQLLEDMGEGRPLVVSEDDDHSFTEFEGRVLTTPQGSAYLKIAEGCDKNCTYCIIPSIRGHYRSRTMEDVLKEAESLARQGARELILVAQETTRYGIDLYGKKSLHLLLQKLSEIAGIRWIRLLYCYPEEIEEELLLEMQKNPKVLPYLDLPIQHASDRILKAMGRKTRQEELIRKIDRIRELMPEICLRTTLITGFPGETEEDHEALKSFVQRIRFDRLGVFTYSPEEGTRAAEMEQTVPEELKAKRREEIMLLQQKISREKNKSFIGKTLDGMVEGILREEGSVLFRTYRDAPNVDGYVFAAMKGDPESGAFRKIRITGATAYDMMGEILDESAE